MKPMPARLASRVNRPRISNTPTIVRPYIVMRLTLSSRFGWLARCLNTLAKGPRDAFMYPTADHDGDVSLAMPS
jgi:hypothetical protein